jgi:hypothetical protein
MEALPLESAKPFTSMMYPLRPAAVSASFFSSSLSSFEIVELPFGPIEDNFAKKLAFSLGIRSTKTRTYFRSVAGAIWSSSWVELPQSQNATDTK